jgi:hypothetical protein
MITVEEGTEEPDLEEVDGYWMLNDENTGIEAIGNDSELAPELICLIEVDGEILFSMSNGETIAIEQTVIVPPLPPVSTITMGMYILSEGSFGQGNGQLAYFDFNTDANTFVLNDSKLVENLGDTPNDLLIYGSKMYCAVTGGSPETGMLKVIDLATGTTISDVVITKEEARQQPRRLAAADGKVYMTLYSGAVAQIDTLSYTPNVIGLSGTFSEGICAYGESLYICNSGQGADNTISVVDIASFTETGTITVPYNPVNIVNPGNGELYFNTAAVYGGPADGAPANVHILNPDTKQVTQTLDIAVESIVAGTDYLYGVAMDWMTYGSIFQKVSLTDKTVSDFTDLDVAADFMLPYKLAVNPVNGEVFVTQQMGDWIYRFTEDGTYVETLETGQQNGSAIAFVNR